MTPPRKLTFHQSLLRSHRPAIPATRIFALLLTLTCAATLFGQQKQTTPPGTSSAPVVDSAADASPATPPPAAPIVDNAAEASPVTPSPHGMALPANVEISIHVRQAADSAHAKNGEMLRATLASPMRGPGGKIVPAGTRVGLTVVTVAPAGKLQSRGEISLQVVSIAGVPVFSETITLHGQPGHKDLPDSAPAKGTEAVVAANTTLHFKIPPPPRQ